MKNNYTDILQEYPYNECLKDGIVVNLSTKIREDLLIRINDNVLQNIAKVMSVRYYDDNVFGKKFKLSTEKKKEVI
jgi:hypothetical protein